MAKTQTTTRQKRKGTKALSQIFWSATLILFLYSAP